MKLNSALKTMFPFIAAASSLGGPLGAMAANAVGKALGVENLPPDKIESAIADAQTKNAEALIALQASEQEFKLQMTKLGFDSVEKLEQIAAADRASARSREVALKDKIPAILAMTVTTGFFGLLAVLAFTVIPERSHDILIAMVGSLGGSWLSIINYYFGSSRGSAMKTEIIADSIKNA